MLEFHCLLFDGFLKMILEEVSSNRLNLLDHPSYLTTMSHLSRLFCVPSPHMITIPLERTTSAEQLNDIYPRSPVFPHYSCLNQLQDLLSVSDIFCDLGNLVVNKDNPWSPCNTFNGILRFTHFLRIVKHLLSNFTYACTTKLFLHAPTALTIMSNCACTHA